MKPVLIVENSTNSLIRENRTQTKDYVMSGIFTQFDIKNRNERVYTANKFLPALEELNQRINDLGVVYGEYDHPDVFDTSLSRASHIIKKAQYIKESNSVVGEIRLLNTQWGKEAKALVDDECPIFVSSRAAGVTESDGSVTLKKLFTYDIVADPGFASAKMSIKSINESLGFKNDTKTNFRIYEMSDESKINQLFSMNKDYVTKDQLTDYSKYLVEQVAAVKKQVNTAISKGSVEPKKLEQLLEYYEELNNSSSKVVQYLDYLAEKVQVVVNENIQLKKTQNNIIKHNDYLAENLERSISYSEYIAETVDKNISYSEYIAEKLDRNIAYSEYIAENVDKNIAYAEYIAENLDKNIAYSEYIAENLDANIAYSEYIAENLDENIAYSEYIAENLDKSVEYQSLLNESLRSSKLNESKGVKFPKFESFFEPEMLEVEEEEEEIVPRSTGEYNNEPLTPEEIAEIEAELEAEGVVLTNKLSDKYEHSFESNEEEEECDTCKGGKNNKEEEEESEETLTESINKLITEAKKRKVSETSDLNFLKFLNKSQVDSFYSLTSGDQELVKLHINESSYFTSKDVLKLISEALSQKNETVEERVLRLMPTETKKVWKQLNESSKKSMLSQAKLYPEELLMTESQIENFWNTRKFKSQESTKKLISHEGIIQEDRLQEKDMNSILERFRNL